MAILHDYKYKGIIANYWKIISVSFNALENKTVISMALYINKDTRVDNINNMIDIKNFEFDGEYNREQSYAKIKESKTETITVPISDPVLDENGNIIEEAKYETTINEINEFFNSVDC